MARTKNLSKNMNAFLDMISFSEGTDIKGSDDGYNVLVGGGLFHDYSRHPGNRIWIPSINNYSTAAGRYQILRRYAPHYIYILDLPDFGPESQDKIAIRLIGECKAINDVDVGDIVSAIEKCSSRWASFPGNSYGQRQEKIEALLIKFVEKGGKLV